jgi:hypothetical protein
MDISRRWSRAPKTPSFYPQSQLTYLEILYIPSLYIDALLWL